MRTTAPTPFDGSTSSLMVALEDVLDADDRADRGRPS
jgi:hypothetical protein